MPAAAVCAVMYDGCVNTIRAAAQAKRKPRLVLLSVIGSEQSSWVWWRLNAAKRGMRQSVADRELALVQSGLPYVICQALKLNNNPGGVVAVAATAASHRLDIKMPYRVQIWPVRAAHRQARCGMCLRRHKGWYRVGCSLCSDP